MDDPQPVVHRPQGRAGRYPGGIGRGQDNAFQPSARLLYTLSLIHIFGKLLPHLLHQTRHEAADERLVEAQVSVAVTHGPPQDAEVVLH